MATYVLIHGAGGSDSWYWHLVAPRLRSLGHDVVAPDLPCDDEGAGWGQYEYGSVVRQPWPLQAWPSVPTRFLHAATTASSRPISCAGRSKNDWAPHQTSSTAAIYQLSVTLWN